MDTPVRYSTLKPFGPVKPRPVRKCSGQHGYSRWSSCFDCTEFRLAMESWMASADARYWCHDPACHVCDPNESEAYGISGIHRVWEQVDHSTMVCPTCGRHYGEYGGCNCRWCGKCHRIHIHAELCSNCGCHGTHCGCATCEACGERTDDTCSSCEMCRSCCECQRCTRCHSTSDSFCEHGWCSDCRRSCQGCRGGYLEEGDYVPLQWKLDTTLANAKQFKRNPIKRLMGVEIEAYAPRWPTVFKTAQKWRAGIVCDSSIEPVSGNSFEITTAPAMGDLFVRQVKELTEAARADDANVNTSCGLHCHVDASSYKWWDVQKLIKLYRVAEPVLFGVCAPYRRKSGFSRPCGDKFYDQFVLGNKGPKELKAKLLSGIYAFDIKDSKKLHRDAGAIVSRAYRQKYNSTRYNALNIHSWFRRGTIEFRHYHGTLSAENIINWAILCGRLIESAEEMGDAEIERLTRSTVLEALKLPAEVRSWAHQRTLYMWTMRSRSEDEQEPLECPDCGNETYECECDN